MRLSDLSPSPGSRKKNKRVGRGPGSGHGKTSCRGHKGQKSRSGGGTRIGFEGGQMPLQRRLPKRGFTNIFQKQYATVNLKTLSEITETVVTPEIMLEKGIIKSIKDGVKILGDGEIKKPLTVKAHAFSASAKEKILKAGGGAEIIQRAKPAPKVQG
ncbi:MAG TPA: 50S ribosomal protein L15 [Nitrospirae bacterium]|nr:50S ribosomal protein L15 [bacterium BMS3Abin10]GBE38716.1 50S ribosomal protein L15 [bacterium BMS3Bbin08]HDH51040.1 50S ribosomal protein L15 [Nitrospirota bacterium]HDK17079.1 50S ribosomal protein L15 [Nitrospirota bacterium]HDK41176.1 50S ribosomal protein L15 [Nitrospirota bacterium]